MYEKLRKYLLMDRWTAANAMFILNGIDPRTATRQETPAGAINEMFELKDDAPHRDIKEVIRAVSELGFIWRGCDHGDDFKNRNQALDQHSYKVSYYIQWADAKGFDVPWLSWAEENGLLNADGKKNTGRQEAEPNAKAVLPTAMKEHSLDHLVTNLWNIKPREKGQAFRGYTLPVYQYLVRASRSEPKPTARQVLEFFDKEKPDPVTHVDLANNTFIYKLKDGNVQNRQLDAIDQVIRRLTM